MNTPKPITLIQLISEQTMQNLLPILRFRPSHVVHFGTGRTATRSNDIVRAASKCGATFQLEQVRLSEMPSIAETSRAVTKAINSAHNQGHIPMVNFTGGTKLMSIGAYSAAANCSPPAISFYVDTDDERFIDGGTAEGLSRLLEGDYSFTQLHDCLDVAAIAAAHGQYDVSKGLDWKRFLPLAQHLLGNHDQEQATFEALFGKNGLFPHGATPKSPEHWLEFIDRPFNLPADVARHAEALGLLRLTPDNSCRLPDQTRAQLTELAKARMNKETVPEYDQKRIEATKACEFTATFLTGGWWEVAVAHAADSTGFFRDLRWSATVGPVAQGGLEEDILAVDGVQMVVISCKRGGNKSRLLPHLEEFNARARRIGGNFTRRILALYLTPNGSAVNALHRRADQLDISILTPDRLNNPLAFARKNK
ncbi:MAG TPA: DUF1887 family CARF protein [Verrucomicrobiota bacterium]|nr:DUF1887 family protein [Verrucomicrobiota bacterium]HOK76084.1 DUF1887 family CARF protein [Verrucomicrobiota bacterium]